MFTINPFSELSELIPVYVKQGLDPAGGTPPKKFLNKTFQGFFYRRSSGRPTSDTPWNDAKYPFDESYLRRYSIISLLQDEQGKWIIDGPGANKTIPEGSLEAVEKYKHIFEERRRRNKQKKRSSKSSQ